MIVAVNVSVCLILIECIIFVCVILLHRNKIKYLKTLEKSVCVKEWNKRNQIIAIFAVITVLLSISVAVVLGVGGVTKEINVLGIAIPSGYSAAVLPAYYKLQSIKLKEYVGGKSNDETQICESN